MGSRSKIAAKRQQKGAQPAPKGAPNKASNKANKAKSSATDSSTSTAGKVVANTATTEAVKEIAKEIVNKDAPKPAQETRREDVFIVPPLLKKLFDVDTIPFYRPALGHQLTQEALYAVRLNEAYADVGAVLEWERIYVRTAMLRAERIAFYHCSAKNPILLLGKFSPTNISSGGRAADDAKNRTTTVCPATNVVPITLPKPVSHLFRLTGPTTVMQGVAGGAAKENYFTAKDSHMPGFSVGHCYMTEEQLAVMRATLCVEKMENIVTSSNAKRQFTMRAEGRDAAAKLVAAALRLQASGALTCLRTFGTLRVTMPSDVTPEVLRKLKIDNQGCRFYTDTPLNVWGTQRQETEKIAIPQGQKLIRVSADYLPHPDEFAAVAAFLGGSVHEIRGSRFTDRPMSCTVVVPSSLEVGPLELNAYQIGQGHWYVSSLAAALV
jgi:hypothetical protein